MCVNYAMKYGVWFEDSSMVANNVKITYVGPTCQVT